MCPTSPARLPTWFVLGLSAILVLGGCSQKAKVERHVASAQRYLAAGQYAAAEIEFVNAQRLDPKNAAAMAGLGALYLDQGSLTKAAPRLMAARELNPEDLDTRVHLARLFAMLGRATEARTEADVVLQRDPQNAEAMQVLAETSNSPEEIADARARLSGETAGTYVARAVLDLRSNDLAGAASHAAQVLALDPKSAVAHSLQASLHLLRKEYDEAEAAMKTAAELSPVRSPRRLALAQVQIARGNKVAARATLEALVQQAPDFLTASLLLAELAAGEGRHEEAGTLVAGVLGRDPDHPEAALLQARLHISRGENTRAIDVLEKLTARFPAAAQMHYMLATAYVAANDGTRAQASLARAIQLSPAHSDAILLRAALQLRSGDPGSAIPPLRELVRNNPDLERAKVLLADALRARGQVDEALQIYRAAIERSPRDPQLRFFAGTLFAQLGRTDDARRSLEEAIALRPGYTAAVEQLIALDLAANDLPGAAKRAEAYLAKHPDALDALVLSARVAVAQKDTARGEATLKHAIELHPEAAAPYMLLAQLYLSDQRQDDALANFQSAAAKNPRDISALMLIGILQHQKGDLQAAREAYEKLLQANPSFVPALNNLAYLCSEHFGELDRAYELANRARELRPNDPVALDTFGWILFQRRDYGWALSVLTESASKLPENPEVQYHLGMTRYMLGDEAGARRALTIATESAASFPGREKAVEYLSVLNTAGGNADDATLEVLRTRVKAMPDDPIALSRLADIQAQRGDHAGALASFEAVLGAHPQSPNAMVNLARYLLTRPDGLPRAFELAKGAYKLAPEDAAVLHVTGLAAFRSGDHAWAASLLREASRRAPDDPRVQADFGLAVYAVGAVSDGLAAVRASLALGGAGREAELSLFAELVQAWIDGTPAATALQRAEDALQRNANTVPAIMVQARGLELGGNIDKAATLYARALALYPELTPALQRRAVLLARANPASAEAMEAASKAREKLPNDAEVAGALGTIHYRRGEYPRAATLLGEAARASEASAEVHAMLGLAQHKLGEKNRARAALQRALELGLSGSLADEVRAALAAL